MICFVQESFAYFNEVFFDDSLRLPSFQIDLSKKFAFRFDGFENQLVIGIGILNVKNKFDFVNYFLHELVHIHNHMNRTEDVNNNQYHSMKFASQALKIGLGVQKDKNQGWSITTIVAPSKARKDFKIHHEANRKLNELVKNFKFDENDYLEKVSLLAGQASLLKPSKLFFLKYECTCPPPHNSVRSGRRPDGNHPVDIVCNICKANFICVSPLDD